MIGGDIPPAKRSKNDSTREKRAKSPSKDKKDTEVMVEVSLPAKLADHSLHHRFSLLG